MASTTDEIRYQFAHTGWPWMVEQQEEVFDAWLAAHDAEVAREAAEKGWREGAMSTEAFYLSRDPHRREGDVLPIPANPYRKEASDE